MNRIFFSPLAYDENYRDILLCYVGVLINCMFYAPSAHKQEQHEKEDTSKIILIYHILLQFISFHR